MPEVERSLEKAPMLEQTESLDLRMVQDRVIYDQSHTTYLYGDLDSMLVRTVRLNLHEFISNHWGEAVGRFEVQWEPDLGQSVIDGIVRGLTEKNRSNKTIFQYFANKTSYECMRDNLHKRPRRRRKHGGRKGEWVR